MKTLKTPTLYIQKTQMILKGRMLKGMLTLQAKLGARGTWNIAGEKGSIYDFASEEDRDAKIAELRGWSNPHRLGRCQINRTSKSRWLLERRLKPFKVK